MSIDQCDDCTRGGSFPLAGPGFSRRNFLQLAGTGIVASFFSDVLSPNLLQAATAVTPTLKRTAKNCILIFLNGAPSQVDMWDLKEGPWTPAQMAPTTYGNDLRFPQGLMPKTAEHLDKLAIVRSGLSWAAVHNLATTWAQISRNPSGALGNVAPHIGSVIALETQKTRQIGDVLPGFVSLNAQAGVGAGYLPAQYAPFRVQPSATGIATLSHPEGTARYEERWKLLHSIDAERTSGSLGKTTLDMNSFYTQGKQLVDSPALGKLFTYTPDERLRYGSTGFGDSLVIARNLVAARRGTRFVQVTLNGWDHHNNIYATQGNSIFTQTAQFDPAFGALLTDLAATPGENGKTLLEDTMVVVIGEFGRTVGALNNQGGRDHHLRMSVVFAGGGVRGGRAIGQTDERGDRIKEFGWSANRDVRPEDVTCTIYSALGIDYTTVRTDDPLGRGFEYVPFAKDGGYKPIEELFS